MVKAVFFCCFFLEDFLWSPSFCLRVCVVSGVRSFSGEAQSSGCPENRLGSYIIHGLQPIHSILLCSSLSLSLFLSLSSPHTHTHGAEGSIGKVAQPSHTPAVLARVLSGPVSGAGRHQCSLSPQMKDKGGGATSGDEPSAGWLAPRNHGIPLATAHTHTSPPHSPPCMNTRTHGNTRSVSPYCTSHTN